LRTIWHVRAQKRVIPLIVILVLNTSAAYGQGTGPITFVVRAEQPGWQGPVGWAEKGVPVQIRASGNWTTNVGTKRPVYVGPEGYDKKRGDFRLGALILQIGCHTDNLSQKKNPKRPPVVVERHAVPGQLVVTPQHGGLVYFYMNDIEFKNNAGAMQVSVAGALPAAVIGKDSDVLRGWPESVAHIKAPWGEFQGDHVVLTLPIEHMRDVKDPGRLMHWWDTLYLHYCGLDGRNPRPLKERFVPDVDLSAGSMHSGYPIVYHMLRIAEIANMDHPKFPRWGFLHELGHRFQRSDYGFEGTGEVTCNIFTLYGYHMMGMEHAVDTKLGLPSGGLRTKVRSKTIEYFGKGRRFEDWQRDPMLGLATFIELIDAFGWDAFKKMFRAYWSLPSDQRPRNDDEKRDLFLKVMSRCTNCNLAPFMDRWGIPVSRRARAAVSHLRPWSGPAEVVEPPPPATR